MKAIGIVAEYNPFHNGHAYQLNTLRRAEQPDAVIAVMSGHFTQRGEAAAFTKWQRARMALTGGADLVIELPFVYAVRSAQYFAAGGVRTLCALGITHLAFGSETEDLSLLKQAADAQLDDTVIASLKSRMAAGISYASALSSILKENYTIPSSVTQAPNNILGIEYCKAFRRHAPSVTPIGVLRQGADHSDEDLSSAHYASGTALRSLLSDDRFRSTRLTDYVPPAAAEILRTSYETNGGLPDIEHLAPLFFGRMLTEPIDTLRRTPGIAEGLENKFLSAAHSARSLEEALLLIKSKRYPMTRLRRTLLHYLLQTSADELADFDILGPQYIRVLGMNERGRAWLKYRKKETPLPILQKITSHIHEKTLQKHESELSPLERMLSLDIRSANLHALCFRPSLPLQQDFRMNQHNNR